MGFSEYVSSPLFIGVPHATVARGAAAAVAASAPAAAPAAKAAAAARAANVVAAAPYQLGLPALPEVQLSGPADATVAAAVLALAGAAAADPKFGAPVLGGLVDKPQATFAVALVGGLMYAWHKVLASQPSSDAAAVAAAISAPNAANPPWVAITLPLAAFAGWQTLPRAPKDLQPALACSNGVGKGAAVFQIGGGPAPAPVLNEYDRYRTGGAPPTVDPAAPILVQGQTLRTWSYRSPAVEQVQVVLSTEGRPLDADIELWQGPDNTPSKTRVYVENGQIRPFSFVVETPRGPNTVAVRNIGQVEFPLAANVFAENVDRPSPECTESFATIQGGALRTYPFDPTVDSVQILLKTDGRPLNARIELLQGPNNNKQVIELYTEDGCDRPFFTIIETPGAGNVVRVVNTAPVEFPLSASIVPNSINQDMSPGAVLGGDVVIGGDMPF